MDLANAPKLADQPAPEAVRPPAGAAPRGRVVLLDRAALRDRAFRTEWDRLVAEASEPNPFFEPWFLLPGLDRWGAAERVTVKAYFAGGRLCGLYPVVRWPRYYGYPVTHATGWLHPNAFTGTPLVARGHEVAFWRAILAHFDRSARRALFLHLPMLTEAGPVGDALETVLAEQGRARTVAKRESRAMLASPLGPEAYLEASMSAKKRKELRRQHKRLAEEGALAFERCEGAEGLAGWTREFLVLEAAGWKGAAGSALASHEHTRTFFAEVLRGAAESGRLERLALRLDGRPVAMLANLIAPPGAFSFKTAFDERFARHSPGLLLQLENLALLDRPGIAFADSCAAEGHSMIERLWREKRSLASHNIAIGGAARRGLFAALTAWENRRGENRRNAR
ncbi:GNAT family N-acetyltransferase [Erythrobacter sp. HL-111]|uniref:GNAT family N-acetyltransferase n=1 Tax=Erythrobacter sp. HL-111 TaxID=1798193 RepID=UPI0006D9985F|nr:GNAT family N-acetyltransferase [Erythrobacter sp. HL-111]KPP93401.1 MAG: Acetyltransferase (GNAT) domain [Erythrobacteraceae bacterium HL-111]SDR70525.1 Acetyltransferase (GNAT) domain-containing protein [Erythrobacter sp. HL-111]